MDLSPEALEAIREENRILEAVLESLHSQISISTGRLQREELRARELTSQLVAARREEDIAMLASDEAVSHGVKELKADEVEGLKKLVKKPYFARVVLREHNNGREQNLEYKIGFCANPDCRIIDWRKAPISKLYYEYREGDEYSEEIQGRERNGVVALRNTVDIESPRLKKLSCRHGSFVQEDSGWVKVDDLARSRGSQAQGGLPSILALISPEQFRTITEEADTAILIQGIAGSGKTTVALHRLAWLLHEENSGLSAERAIVVVLNNALRAFVSNTLPSMEIHGVRVLTYREWAAETITRAAPQFVAEHGLRRPFDPCPSSVERVMKSMALLRLLEEAVLSQAETALQEIDTITKSQGVPAGARVLFESLRKQPYGAVVRELVKGLGENDRRSPYGLKLEEIRNRVDSFAADIATALHSGAKLIESDETKLLDREVIERARARFDLNCGQQMLDPCADPLFLRLHQLKYGCLFFRDGSSGRYEHVVADEVQDMSPVELATIIGAVEDTRNLTLVGDIAQKIDQSSVFPGWEKLRQQWDFKDSMSRYVTLQVSHRSTLPIMRLADYVQRRQTVKEGRPGRVPIWFKCYSQEKGIGAVIQWLSTAIERFPHAITAVICRDGVEAKHALSLLKPTFGPIARIGDDYSFSFAEGIIVTSVGQVKGLEFFNVLIWNPHRKAYLNEDLGRNLLYVAMTRAEENLCLVTWNRPSPLLPPVTSNLVRGIELGLEELEEERKGREGE